MLTVPVLQKLRYRLLLSYLAVLSGILAGFAIAVRLVFLHNLTRHTIEELTILAQSAAGTAELQNGHLSVGDEFSTKNLVPRGEALQWFDLQQRLIAQQGKNTVDLPLVLKRSVQIQKGNGKFLAVTLPIILSDDRRLIGYVRASESLDTEDKTLEKLDWGLGVGIVTALVMSGIGGVWLTRQAMQPAEQSFQQLKQFTADASHELRSPLMAIKSNAAVALKYSEGMRPIDADKFAAIASATEQMAHLTEDLLLLARTDQTAELKPATVHLTKVLEDLVVLYHPQADAKQIALIAQLDNLSVWGDGAELRRVFTNLLDNALHYTPDGGRIEIQARQTNRFVEVSIQDTGIGIAPENLKRVFDRFWRADQSRSRWAGGSGLGLVIVQAIVQRHGGSITVTSALGIGSCFTVQLTTSPTRSNAKRFQC